MADEPNLNIDSKQLREIVSQALNEKIIRLGKWQVKSLHGGFEMEHRLLRLSGQARTPTGSRPWSLVLKIASCTEARDSHPDGHHFWAREAMLYESGMLSNRTGSLITPRCYQVSQHGDEYWLWLEEVKDDLGKPWPVDHLGEAARCLGRFNGAYLAGRALPDEPWLSQHWLRGYVESSAPTIQDLPELRKLPYFQHAYSALSYDFLLEAWERRGEFLRVLEGFPQTFCHQDAFAGNLFWRRGSAGQGLLIGIDWAFTGIASVGEELAPLVAMASFGDSGTAIQLTQVCLEGYLTGLGEAGWTADPQMVSFSCLTAIFYRYLFGAMFGEMWPILRHGSNHPMMAALFGFQRIDEFFDTLTASNRAYLDIYQQISPLLKQFA